MKKCDACWLLSNTAEYIKVRTTNGALLLCRQCLDDINRKNPELKKKNIAKSSGTAQGVDA